MVDAIGFVFLVCVISDRSVFETIVFGAGTVDLWGVTSPGHRVCTPTPISVPSLMASGPFRGVPDSQTLTPQPLIRRHDFGEKKSAKGSDLKTQPMRSASFRRASRSRLRRQCSQDGTKLGPCKNKERENRLIRSPVCIGGTRRLQSPSWWTWCSQLRQRG